MSSKSHLSRLTEIYVDQLGIQPEKVTPEAKFIEDFGVDSLDQVELVMAVEEEFDIEIADEEAEKLVTVQDVLDYLQGKVGDSPE